LKINTGQPVDFSQLAKYTQIGNHFVYFKILT